MSKTRNNHYVPQWYQEGFFEIGRSTLAYLDMKPPQRILDGGHVTTERALFDARRRAPFSNATYIRRSSERPSTTRLSAICLATSMLGARKLLGLLQRLMSAYGTAISRLFSNTSTSRKCARPMAWTERPDGILH